MNSQSDTASWSGSPVPSDDPKRNLIPTRSEDPNLPHIGLVGDTYATLLTGKDTAGRFCLIDVHIPPGGGPPPHRHDFEGVLHHYRGRDRGYLSRRKVRRRCWPDRSCSCQRASSVSQQERPGGTSVMHLLSCRTGRVLRTGGRPGCNPHDPAPKARRKGSG